MRDPISRLKMMPWGMLFLGALLTTIVAVALDLLLLVLATQIPLLANALTLLFSPPLGIIMNIVVYVGVGALGILLLERFLPRLSITIANLWGFLFCLIVVMSLLAFVPLPSLLVGAAQGSVIGLLVGVFAASTKYWRYGRW